MAESVYASISQIRVYISSRVNDDWAQARARAVSGGNLERDNSRGRVPRCETDRCACRRLLYESAGLAT